MKKALLSSLLLSFTMVLLGQSTTADWFYKNGAITKKFAVSNANDFVGIEEGLDMVWDFSTASPVNSSDTLFEYYVAVESMSNFEEFPNADLGRISGALEFYFDVQDDVILVDGLYANENVVLTYPGGYHLAYAYGYNEAKTRDLQIVTYNNATDDTLSIVPITSTLEIVGQGTVITPEGSYDNCILQKRTRTADGEIVFEAWAFYKDNFENQLATLNRSVNANGQDNYSFTYQTQLDELLPSGIEDQLLDWEIYSDGSQLHITTDRSYEFIDFQVLDMSGRQIVKYNQPLDYGENVVGLDQLVNTGQYVLFVLDKEGRRFNSFKFFVVK